MILHHIALKINVPTSPSKSQVPCTHFLDYLTANMSSPLSSREVCREQFSPIAVPIASKQRPTIATNKLPLPPPRRIPGSKTVTQEKRSYSPSLVQFSRQQKRSRLTSDLFSILRSTLIVASLAGIALGVVHARSTETAFLYFNTLKLLFVCFLYPAHFHLNSD